MSDVVFFRNMMPQGAAVAPFGAISRHAADASPTSLLAPPATDGAVFYPTAGADKEFAVTATADTTSAVWVPAWSTTTPTPLMLGAGQFLTVRNRT